MASLADVDRTRLVWWVVGFALAAAVAFVVYSFVGTFVFGVFIYYATRPVYRRIKSRVRPPSLAAAVALLTLALPALLLLAYTVAIALQEFNSLSKRVDLGQFESIVQPYVDVSRVVQDPETLLTDGGLDALGLFFDQAIEYLGFLGNGALHLFVMIVLAFYLLRDDHRLAAWFHRRFDDRRGVVEAYARRVDRDFTNVFFGNILNALLTAIIGAVSYNVIQFFSPAGVSIPYPTLMGLLTGVASLVPVVGIKLVYVPLAAVLTAETALVSTDLLWFPAVFVVVSFLVVDVIPDLVLRPYVAGRGLHVGLVMFAYIFGPLLWGWYGIFLGPVLLVLVVHFARLVLPELLAGQPIEPRNVGPELQTHQSARPTPGADEVDACGEAATRDGSGSAGDDAGTGASEAGDAGAEPSGTGDGDPVD